MTEADLDAHFKFWLHQQGYTFTGDTSFYRLTLPELRTLRAGYEVDQQLAEDAQHGVTPTDRQRFKQFEQDLKTGRFDANT